VCFRVTWMTVPSSPTWRSAIGPELSEPGAILILCRRGFQELLEVGEEGLVLKSGLRARAAERMERMAAHRNAR
jgi:hypothetical protein